MGGMIRWCDKNCSQGIIVVVAIVAQNSWFRVFSATRAEPPGRTTNGIRIVLFALLCSDYALRRRIFTITGNKRATAFHHVSRTLRESISDCNRGRVLVVQNEQLPILWRLIHSGHRIACKPD